MKKDKEKINQSIIVPISGFNFYLARQGGYDAEGRYSEVACILDITIPQTTTLSGKVFNTISINFRSVGGIRTVPVYSGRKVYLELSEKDLSYWMTALQFPRLELHLEVSDPSEDPYFRIYLSAGK